MALKQHYTQSIQLAVRTIALPNASGTVALTSNIGDGILTVQGNTGLSGSGTFTANQSGEAIITLTNSDRGSSQNIFKNFTDGTTTAAADSNNDTFKFRGSGVTVAVQNDNATHGDNLLISWSHPTFTFSALTAGAETTLTDITLVDSLTASNGHISGGTYRKLVAGSNITITPAADGNITIASSYINTASAVDNILDGSNSGTAITYAPYAAQQAKLSFDTSTTAPARTDRLNLNGYLYGQLNYIQVGNEGLYFIKSTNLSDCK